MTVHPDFVFLRRRPRPAPAAPPRTEAPTPPYRAGAVVSGTTVVLTPSARMVHLDRVQSGVGLLTVEATWPGARLGCAYALVGGQSSIVCHSAGLLSAPRTSRNPIILARQRKFDRLSIDLRQSRSLARMIVYGIAGTGPLVVTTFGGACVEMAADGSGVSVFMSLYNVNGELVIRAEPPNSAPDVRRACEAYGFDRMNWLDDNNPAT